MISAVVLTKNEEASIERCLQSLMWCEEIIVIDDLSADATIKNIQALRELKGKVRVYERSGNGDLAGQRNFALDKTTEPWVLFVDADETVSPELAKEIQNTTKDTQSNGFYLPRRDYFMGRFLQHGETGEIKLLRLGRKGKGSWRRKVHEIWEIEEPTGELTSPLEHYSHPSIKEFISKINLWTDWDAGELKREGKSGSVFRMVFNPLGKFIVNYFFKLGLLDGFPGLVMAFMMSLNSLIVRVKLFELEHPARNMESA